MAPQSRSHLRHPDPHSSLQHPSNADDIDQQNPGEDLFVDPMMGIPLALYIEKEVDDRDTLVELITKYGGTVSPGYSGVPYILVNPRKESGQSLYRQYAGKKGKIVLDARWVHECVQAGSLQTFHTNWAGCKVTGTELVKPIDTSANTLGAPSSGQMPRRGGRQSTRGQATNYQAPPPQAPVQTMQPSAMQQSPLTPGTAFPYSVYHNAPPPQPPHPSTRPGAMQTPTSAPPQTWQAANGIAPHQTHITHPHAQQHTHMIPPVRPPPPYGREDHWSEGTFHTLGPSDAAPPPPPHMAPMNDTQAAAAGYYEARFREEAQGWAGNPQEYYDQAQYEQAYPQAESYMPIPGPSSASHEQPNTSISNGGDKPRGRKRTRAQPTPAPPASALVLNRRHPPARSPTPPTRVIKSTYGGNLFTADDVVYLKKYIDYCQEQGLVLSLREICERIAVKAPHHTFYSWRRYCNKHQIRLGGYAMDVESRSPSPSGRDMDDGQQQQQHHPHMGNGGNNGNLNTPSSAGPGPGTVAAAQRMMQEDGMRNRSPTPPRALFRSTTGKGVAFTDEDVAFLVKFLAYRNSQGRCDMVSFWKDVAAKAPHHSRASWMKYYRRHKHELNRVDGDDPLPVPPAKKMRYGKDDDILLAKYFVHKPEGTSDKIFQDFARSHPHHPWKGWQEHHRIHKAKIDHLIQRLANGETIDTGGDDDE